jgi:hypothetical protein
MADKDESTSDAVTIDTNPGYLFAHRQNHEENRKKFK